MNRRWQIVALAELLLVPALAFVSPACSPASSSSATSPSPTETADDAGVDAGSDADEDARSPACVAQDTALNAAVAKAGKSVPNAIVALQNDACGSSVYMSGSTTTATIDSTWRIGSITKTFVSAVILSLVHDGAVALTDPLSKYVTNVPNTDGVTVRMLMNHTSGIPDYTQTAAFNADPKQKWTPRELVDLVASETPAFAPGASFQYSNTNYILLGMIAETASSQSIGDLVRDRALVPAGLTQTYFDGEEPTIGTLARGFDGKTDVTTLDDPSGPWCAGAMVASASDVVQWAAALYGTQTVLTPDAYADLVANPADNGEYGLGVIFLPSGYFTGYGPAIGHDGAIDGYLSQVYYFPEDHLTMAAIVNQDTADANAIMVAALKALKAVPSQ